MNEQEQFQMALGKIEAALSMKLVALAMQGCIARDLWLTGHEQKANEAIRGSDQLVKAMMDLAHDLESRIRSGAGLSKALKDMCDAGWLQRIDDIEDGE